MATSGSILRSGGVLRSRSAKRAVAEVRQVVQPQRAGASAFGKLSVHPASAIAHARSRSPSNSYARTSLVQESSSSARSDRAAMNSIEALRISPSPKPRAREVREHREPLFDREMIPTPRAKLHQLQAAKLIVSLIYQRDGFAKLAERQFRHPLARVQPRAHRGCNWNREFDLVRAWRFGARFEFGEHVGILIEQFLDVFPTEDLDR